MNLKLPARSRSTFWSRHSCVASVVTSLLAQSLNSMYPICAAVISTRASISCNLSRTVPKITHNLVIIYTCMTAVGAKFIPGPRCTSSRWCRWRRDRLPRAGVDHRTGHHRFHTDRRWEDRIGATRKIILNSCPDDWSTKILHVKLFYTYSVVPDVLTLRGIKLFPCNK